MKGQAKLTVEDAPLQLGFDPRSPQSVHKTNVLQLFVQEIVAALETLYQAAVLVRGRQRVVRIHVGLYAASDRSLEGKSVHQRRRH